MDLKCVQCNGDAAYIRNGYSLCVYHFRRNEYTWETEEESRKAAEEMV